MNVPETGPEPVRTDGPRLGPDPAGPRRSRWTRGRALLLGGVAVVVLAVAAFVGCGQTRSGAEDVVRDYLDTLRRGDAQAALAFTSDMEEFDTASDALLTDEALAGDWRLTELVYRPGVDETSAVVDVTITAADRTSRNGRFIVEAAGADSWRIVNPLVKVDLTLLPMRFAEFNGVVVDAEALRPPGAADAETEPASARVWMFPGTYAAYGSSAKLIELSAETFVAAPSSPYEPAAYRDAFLPRITPGEDFEGQAGAQFADWIDACAKTGEVSPTGCPFAGDLAGSPDQVELAGGEVLRVDEVDWKVKSYPKVRLLQAKGHFAVQELEPGEITISGTGIDRYGDDQSEQDFKADCDIELGHAVAELVAPREFRFSGWGPGDHDPVSYTCLLRYE